MKRWFVTDSSGIVIRQGTCRDELLGAQLGSDGVALYSAPVDSLGVVDDSLYQIGPSGGFVPRPGVTEPDGGFAPPSGTLIAENV